jgi:hypothetical protein
MIRGFLSRLFLPEAQPQPRLGSTGALAKPDGGQAITTYPARSVSDEPVVLRVTPVEEEAPDILAQTVRRWLSVF